MASYDINYESLVSFTLPNLCDQNEIEALELFKFHGLETFLSNRPTFLLEAQVSEFFKHLRRDSDSGVVTTYFTATDAAGATVQIEMDVRSEISFLFQLPFLGSSSLSIDSFVVATAMASAIAQGKSTGTVLAVDFKSKPKFALKIVKNSLLGMLGSFHQISFPQQKILTALLGDEQWNWEELFVSSLLDLAKGSKLRLCTKVSALILHAVQGRELIWSRTTLVNVPILKAKIDKTLLVAEKKKKSTNAKGSKSSSSLKKGKDESAGNTGGRTFLPPVPETSVAESMWKFIPVAADEAVDMSSAVPLLSCIPSSTPAGAELTSASEKALGKHPVLAGPLPTSLVLTNPQTAPLPQTPHLPMLSTAPSLLKQNCFRLSSPQG